MISSVFALLLLQASASGAEPAQGPVAPPPACVSEEHSAFDFWVGEWDVYGAIAPDRKIADSRIEKLASGCAVRETWMPLSSGGGTSLTMLNHRSGRWEQVWIGSDGKRVDFTGGMVDGKMVITGYWDGVGPGGSDALIRMTYTYNKDGSVRQFGEVSTDHGVSWQSAFDLNYRPKKDAPE